MTETIKAWGNGERRDVAHGTAGVVASDHPYATAAGVRVLEAGGNAMDAILSAAFVSAVVLPAMCGLGGDCFILFYSARDRHVSSICGSGKAPKAASLALLRGRGYERTMPLRGPLSVSVPGMVDACYRASEHWGSLPMKDLLAAAHSYALDGIVLREVDRGLLHWGHELIAEHSSQEAAQGFAQSEQGALARFKIAGLAETISLLREQGSRGFYQGEIAQRIGDWMTEHEGLLTSADLAEQCTAVSDSLRTSYGSMTLHTQPLPSQGVLLLSMMNIASQADWRKFEPQGADAVHLLVEAYKKAASDRIRYCADPDFVDVPLGELLSAEWAAKNYRAIQDRASEDRLSPYDEEGETTCLVAADGNGNAAVLIHSLSNALGSACVVDGTGIVLNNRAGRGFSLVPGHPNVLAPGKRTMHTLHGFMVTDEMGALSFAGGTVGGDRQPQWNAQVISNVMNFGMSLQQAVEAPRWSLSPGTDPADSQQPFKLSLEQRFDDATRAALQARGHRLEMQGPWSAKSGMQLVAHCAGTSFAASDPRSGGLALGV